MHPSSFMSTWCLRWCNPHTFNRSASCTRPKPTQHSTIFQLHSTNNLHGVAYRSRGSRPKAHRTEQHQNAGYQNFPRHSTSFFSSLLHSRVRIYVHRSSSPPSALHPSPKSTRRETKFPTCKGKTHWGIFTRSGGTTGADQHPSSSIQSLPMKNA